MNTPSVGTLEIPETLPVRVLPETAGTLTHDPVTGRWLKGHHTGRPKGIRNAQKAFYRAAPKMMKAYITQALKGNAAVLTDARRAIVPSMDQDDGQAGSTTNMVIFVGDGSLPRASDSV